MGKLIIKGFTILETLVAILVLTITFGFLFVFLSGNLKSYERSKKCFETFKILDTEYKFYKFNKVKTRTFLNASDSFRIKSFQYKDLIYLSVED